MGARRRTILTLHLPMMLADFAAVLMKMAELYDDARVGLDKEGRPVVTTAKTVSGQLDLGDGDEE